jgi:hypothetical protein
MMPSSARLPGKEHIEKEDKVHVRVACSHPEKSRRNTSSQSGARGADVEKWQQDNAALAGSTDATTQWQKDDGPQTEQIKHDKYIVRMVYTLAIHLNSKVPVVPRRKYCPSIAKIVFVNLKH